MLCFGVESRSANMYHREAPLPFILPDENNKKAPPSVKFSMTRVTVLLQVRKQTPQFSITRCYRSDVLTAIIYFAMSPWCPRVPDVRRPQMHPDAFCSALESAFPVQNAADVVPLKPGLASLQRGQRPSLQPLPWLSRARSALPAPGPLRAAVARGAARGGCRDGARELGRGAASRAQRGGQSRGRAGPVPQAALGRASGRAAEARPGARPARCAAPRGERGSGPGPGGGEGRGARGGSSRGLRGGLRGGRRALCEAGAAAPQAAAHWRRLWTLNFLCSFVSVNSPAVRTNGLKLCGSLPQTLAKGCLCSQLKGKLTLIV